MKRRPALAMRRAPPGSGTWWVWRLKVAGWTVKSPPPTDEALRTEPNMAVSASESDHSRPMFGRLGFSGAGKRHAFAALGRVVDKSVTRAHSDVKLTVLELKAQR